MCLCVPISTSYKRTRPSISGALYPERFWFSDEWREKSHLLMWALLQPRGTFHRRLTQKCERPGNWGTVPFVMAECSMVLNVADRRGLDHEPGPHNLTSTHQQKWWVLSQVTNDQRNWEYILPICKVQYYVMYFSMFSVFTFTLHLFWP